METDCPIALHIGTCGVRSPRSVVGRGRVGTTGRRHHLRRGHGHEPRQNVPQEQRRRPVPLRRRPLADCDAAPASDLWRRREVDDRVRLAADAAIVLHSRPQSGYAHSGLLKCGRRRRCGPGLARLHDRPRRSGTASRDGTGGRVGACHHPVEDVGICSTTGPSD